MHSLSVAINIMLGFLYSGSFILRYCDAFGRGALENHWVNKDVTLFVMHLVNGEVEKVPVLSLVGRDGGRERGVEGEKATTWRPKL